MPQKEGRRETQMRTETEADPHKIVHPPHLIHLIHTQSPPRQTQSEHETPQRGRGFTEKGSQRRQCHL